MAQKVEVMLVCDLHDDEVEGVDTVAFGLDGSSYEIDVCDKHSVALRDAFAPYVGAGRRAGKPAAPARRGRASTPATSTPATSSAAKERTQDIREWARSNGHAISERGRLPSAVLAAYDAAH